MSSTAAYESAHAALAIAAGMVPEQVRVDNPDLGIAGRCTANWRDHEPDTDWLIAVLGGPLSEGVVLDWRPMKDAHTDDERIAATLVEHLGLERHEYLDALATAEYLLARDEVRAVVRLIATALDRVLVLSERQLRELLGREWLDHFNISNRN